MVRLLWIHIVETVLLSTQKLMLKLMGKKIITILCSKVCLSKPLVIPVYSTSQEVVMLLIEEGADVSIKNDEGLLPKEMTKNKEIIRLIEGMILLLC